MNSELSKQEYLKRYLEKNDEVKKPKRKKNVSKTILPRVKIVHEDLDIKSLKFCTKEDTDDEEDPVIAEVVDDRPVEVKSKETYDSSRWKRLGESDKDSSSEYLVKNKIPGKIRSSGNESRSGKTRLRHDSDSDCSPPRKAPIPTRRKTKKQTKHSEKENEHSHTDSDLSPARLRCNRDEDSDLSPPRKDKCNDDNDSDLSPPRKSAENSQSIESRRPTKTLSGLKAGLQNAATLRQETKNLRKRESTHIKELDEELSGRNANTVLRDKHTGKRRNLEMEQQVDDEKEKKILEQQQKYAQWSKGMSQSENKLQKLSEDLHEISKPLARYCDDEDLEEKQKAEIRDDDPMAQYMRKKKQKTTSTVFPVYSGPPPPPNRFGIPPGYRWDGVDRSNGFEKQYFEQKSNKQAVEKEAFLWSVQDM